MRFDAALYKKLIPKALKRAREQAGLSIEEAAKQTGITTSTFYNNEFGIHLPAMDYFLLELQIYGLDFGRFHELLLEVYADLVHDETSERMDKLELRLQAMEEGLTPNVKAG